MPRKEKQYCKQCHKGWKGVETRDGGYFTDKPDTRCCGKVVRSNPPFYTR